MNFPYTKVIDFPKHQKRERLLPWIRFGIFNPKSSYNILYPLGLVDSGSEITFITYEFAENLGFDIKKGKKVEVVGVGGGKIDVFLHEVGFQIGDSSKEKPIIYKSLAAFTYGDFPSSMPQQTAILGTLGFFEYLDVTFRYPREIIIESKIEFKKRMILKKTQ